MKWVVCIKNAGFEASLKARKLYNLEDDKKAQALGLVRVVDESGEVYLYPQEIFAPMRFKTHLKKSCLLLELCRLKK